MSLNLITIKSEQSLMISNFLENYFLCLNKILPEVGYNLHLYVNDRACVAIVFESSCNLSEINEQEFTLQKIKWTHNSVYILKAVVKNDINSQNELIAKIKNISNGDLLSRFIALEHTSMLTDDLASRPPSLTENGKIYLPVGMIGHYFIENSPSYLNDSRGSDFANLYPNMNLAKITDKYFSNFLDGNKISQITDIKQTGLKHFTIVIYERQTHLQFLLLQNLVKFNFARYTLKPDLVACSNEEFLKEYLMKIYKKEESIKIESSLKEIKLDLASNFTY